MGKEEIDMAMQVIGGDKLGHELVDDVLLLGSAGSTVGKSLVVSGHTLPSASVTVPAS